MKLEENRTLRAQRHASGAPVNTAADFSSWIVRNLPGEDEKYVAIAPGRLDVLGGVAEYTGGLVLAVPLAEHACVGVQRRTDGLLHITRHHSASGNGAAPCEMPLARFRGDDGSWLSPPAGREMLRPYGDMIACCAGTIIEAMRTGALGALSGGMSLAIASDLEDVSGVGVFAAASSAVLVSAAALTHEVMEPNVAALISQTLENDWLESPVGPADALCALLGEANGLTQLRCDNRTLGSTLPLPCDLRLVAIDSGHSQPGHCEKYAQVRTATFMGRLLIDRIVRHEGLLAKQWDGYLSRISVNDYVEHLRDRLPTKMSGREFLDRFGETGDRLTRIDPKQTYKIRSRTEHHVYEHARSRQFVEAIARGIRNDDRSAFVDAGSAMNASHWSGGQRCGMGSAPANSLVNALRKADPAAGIFGSRIAGRGCGGMVAVLAEDSQAAQQVLEDSIEAYARDYNVPARILTGSLAGAMVRGAVRV